ncbi:hypothetical protein GH714_012439 [Hevea brasiliensis]|uniref:Starch synthase, chloroplastic/amyloplastic n=1 Tax=Hevea brasiliensis TaxID=3981 RepID=A0A6A6MIL7_HEVBR|nr:hypothetical protein GH714_012439 [Hevea brasiliensis]
MEKEAIDVKEVLKAIERCIEAFWTFVKTDSKKPWWKLRSSLWTCPPVEDPRDLKLLADLTRTLHKKELWLKDSEGKQRCWFRRVVKPDIEKSQRKEMLFTMIYIKLISRVLQLPVLSSAQLNWCQEKLDNIQFQEGKIVRASSSGLLFPPDIFLQVEQKYMLGGVVWCWVCCKRQEVSSAMVVSHIRDLLLHHGYKVVSAYGERLCCDVNVGLLRVKSISSSNFLPVAAVAKGDDLIDIPLPFYVGPCLSLINGKPSYNSSTELLRFKPVRATGKEDISGDGSEDTLQATIEKSKKVLAIQRDLLRQIAERRKLVSSIQSSVGDHEVDRTSHEQRENSLPNSGNTSTIDVNMLEQQNGAVLPSSVHATADEVPETSSSAISGGHAKVEKELEQNVSPTTASFVKNSTKLLKEMNSEKVCDSMTEDTKPPPLAGANVMNVILVAAECAPWSKTGGLGDVAGSLPKALARRGHRVMVVAPRYGNYAEPLDTGVRKRYKVMDFEVSYFQAFIDGVDFVFIESPIFRHIENNIYGGNRLVPWHVPCGGVCYGDGNLAFIANDWHTALVPVYLKAYYRDNGVMRYARSVFVIHNIAYQGRGPVDDFSYMDLPEHYIDLFKLYDPVGGDHFNIFAAGLKTADRVVTVSHGYAWELKTSEGGWGLHNIISENDWKLRGIVNGIDAKEWNPLFDIHLTSDGYTNYSLETLDTGKPQCKAALQKELGLPIRPDVPVIGFIGRLDHQKGVDLIAEAVPWMMGQDVQLVMLGSGRQDLEDMLRKFESQHTGKVRGWVGFSVKTAHRITAGADILLMPSRFEPCGLNQLYAMTYGTVPVVHAVGGLRDTVQPFDPFNESGLGWTFDSAESNKLINALGNCLLTYRQYKKSWEGLQRRGMTQDLSWDHAAEKYEEILVAAKYQW